MSANIDLVTSHKGSAHITTQNVIDLISGLSGNISGIKVFPSLYNGLEHEIIDTLEIRVKTGAALADGYFFILSDAYDWILDPGTVGYSRIDILYLVLYEDPDTNVQTADLVYQVGTDYQNGTTGTEPDAPTGTNVIGAHKLVRMDMTDGAIVSVTDYATPYLSNDSLATTIINTVEELEESVGGTVEQVQTNTNALNGLRFGVDSNGKYGYYKAGADSVTPFRNPTGDAVASNVLSGKVFSNATNDNLSGTMANRGAWTGTGTPTGNNQVNVSIPAGYHDGNGYVICKGQTAYAAGAANKYNEGRAQGRADKSSGTLQLETYYVSSHMSLRAYWNGNVVMDTRLDGNPKTLYTSYNGGLSTS